MGTPAIAITDHGVVQALADVFHTWQDLYKGAKAEAEKEGKQLDRQDFFKVICGCEIYLVDDLKNIVVNPKGQSLMDPFVVFDIETTDFSSVTNHIIEIGAVKVENGKIVDRFSTYVNPQEPIPYRITKLTTITVQMSWMHRRSIRFCRSFLHSVKAVYGSAQASFDTGFIRKMRGNWSALCIYSCGYACHGTSAAATACQVYTGSCGKDSRCIFGKPSSCGR